MRGDDLAFPEVELIACVLLVIAIPTVSGMPLSVKVKPAPVCRGAVIGGRGDRVLLSGGVCVRFELLEVRGVYAVEAVERIRCAI